VILPVPKRFINLALNRLEIIVPPQISIDIIPALEVPTDKSDCITGQAAPRRESGKPRLMKAKYIIIKSSVIIIFSF
jgi:hypothetical protein